MNVRYQHNDANYIDHSLHLYPQRACLHYIRSYVLMGNGYSTELLGLLVCESKFGFKWVYLVWYFRHIPK